MRQCIAALVAALVLCFGTEARAKDFHPLPHFLEHLYRVVGDDVEACREGRATCRHSFACTLPALPGGHSVELAYGIGPWGVFVTNETTGYYYADYDGNGTLDSVLPPSGERLSEGEGNWTLFNLQFLAFLTTDLEYVCKGHLERQAELVYSSPP